MDRVATDILGPFPQSSSGNRYILLVGDYFTRWIEAYAIPEFSAKTVAEKSVYEFFSRFGTPLDLHSDQGRNYEASLFKEVCRLLEINKTRSSPFHPQSNGMIERSNKTGHDCSDLLFEVKSHSVGKSKILHFDRLKPYTSDSVPEMVEKLRNNIFPRDDQEKKVNPSMRRKNSRGKCSKQNVKQKHQHFNGSEPSYLGDKEPRRSARQRKAPERLGL